MLTRHAITRRADTDGVDAAVVERDYVLAHVVAQLHHARPDDRGRLIFKGGTALRFIYLPDYRYSADLDFTVLSGSAEASAASLGKVLEAAREHAGLPHLELRGDDKPAIAYVGPLGAARPRQIKLDLATDDEHVESVEERTLRGVWPDLPDPVPLAVYPIEEIGAEKLRCVIQRVQCRDLYDLFPLTADAGLSLAEIRPRRRLGISRLRQVRSALTCRPSRGECGINPTRCTTAGRPDDGRDSRPRLRVHSAHAERPRRPCWRQGHRSKRHTAGGLHRSPRP